MYTGSSCCLKILNKADNYNFDLSSIVITNYLYVLFVFQYKNVPEL